MVHVEEEEEVQNEKLLAVLKYFENKITLLPTSSIGNWFQCRCRSGYSSGSGPGSRILETKLVKFYSKMTKKSF